MDLDWRSRCGGKLVPLESAMERVQSGQTVAVAPYTCSPTTLCHGLIERGRKGELENVRIDHLASLISWTEPELRGVVPEQGRPRFLGLAPFGLCLEQPVIHVLEPALLSGGFGGDRCMG